MATVTDEKTCPKCAFPGAEAVFDIGKDARTLACPMCGYTTSQRRDLAQDGRHFGGPTTLRVISGGYGSFLVSAGSQIVGGPILSSEHRDAVLAEISLNADAVDLAWITREGSDGIFRKEYLVGDPEENELMSNDPATGFDRIKQPRGQFVRATASAAEQYQDFEGDPLPF